MNIAMLNKPTPYLAKISGQTGASYEKNELYARIPSPLLWGLSSCKLFIFLKLGVCHQFVAVAVMLWSLYLAYAVGFFPCLFCFATLLAERCSLAIKGRGALVLRSNPLTHTNPAIQLVVKIKLSFCRNMIFTSTNTYKQQQNVNHLYVPTIFIINKGENNC